MCGYSPIISLTYHLCLGIDGVYFQSDTTGSTQEAGSQEKDQARAGLGLGVGVGAQEEDLFLPEFTVTVTDPPYQYTPFPDLIEYTNPPSPQQAYKYSILSSDLCTDCGRFSSFCWCNGQGSYY